MPRLYGQLTPTQNHGTTDSDVPMASIKPHRLSEGGPREIIFEFNQMPTSAVVEAIWDKPPFFRHQPAFRFPDCLLSFSVLPFFSTGRSLWADRLRASMRFTTVEGADTGASFLGGIPACFCLSREEAKDGPGNNAQDSLAVRK